MERQHSKMFGIILLAIGLAIIFNVSIAFVFLFGVAVGIGSAR